MDKQKVINELYTLYESNTLFSDKQLEYIRYGLENDLDVEVYANPEISETLMDLIVQQLQQEHAFTIFHRMKDYPPVYICNVTAKTKAEACAKFRSDHSDAKVVRVELCSALCISNRFNKGGYCNV